MKFTLKIWRQSGPSDKGGFTEHVVDGITDETSFLEMLDVLNDQLESSGHEPITFESDCREGVCGVCGAVVDGLPHGKTPRATLCQLHMREFTDGQTITVEPFRSRAFPIIKDLVVDRSAMDRIIQAGGYVTIRTGSAPDAHVHNISKETADRAFDAAACIGCGACVAACPNAAAMLFTGAKVAHLGVLPQGQVERYTRVQGMVDQYEEEGFGHCTNHEECVRACPKGIKLEVISRMNRDYLRAQFVLRK